MAKLGSSFNASEQDTTQTDYANLPNGNYKLEVEASEVKEGDEGRITVKTTINVLEPEAFKDRKIFNNYNLSNPNQQAQEIGQRQFAMLCRAIGVNEVEDTEDLHLLPFMARIGLGKPSKDGQYAARSEIKKYFYPDEGDLPDPEIDENQPVAAPVPKPKPVPSRPAPQAASLVNKSAKPWGAKK